MKISYEELRELSLIIKNNIKVYTEESNELFKNLESLQEEVLDSQNLSINNAVLSYKDSLENIGKVCNDYANYLDEFILSISNEQNNLKNIAENL